MPLPKCSVYIAASIDGFIAGPDGDLGWLSVVEEEGADYGFTPFFASVDTMLMGRATYDAVVAMDSVEHYAGKRTVVLTRRDAEPHDGVEFTSGDVRSVLERLGSEGAKHVYADGGDVIHQVLCAGVVDALTVSVIPVLLGGGTPLFKPGLPSSLWSLEGCESFPAGLVQYTYRPKAPL